ncbi:MAG: hypothetical protein V1779_05235 [bacterium]
MIKKILIPALIIFGLIACSERYPNSPYYDDTESNGNTVKNKVRYFPDQIGSYWIYETYDLDTLDRIELTSLSIDSIIVESELMKANKKAKQFVRYSRSGLNYQKAGEFYYAIEGNKLYSLQTYLSKFFQGMPYQLVNFSDSEWIKIVDPDDDLWRIYRMNLEDVSIPNLPFVKLNGKIDVLASWEGKETLNVNGKSIVADEYLITFEFDADLTIPLFGNINIGIERELYQYYANDIGLVFETLSSSALSFPVVGNINLPGYQSKLIKFNIK